MRHLMRVCARDTAVTLLVAVCTVAFFFGGCGTDINKAIKDQSCVIYEWEEVEGANWTDPQGIGNLKINAPCMVYGNIHETGYQEEEGYLTGTYLGDEDFYAVYTPDRDDLYLWIRITWETDSEFDMYIGEVSVIPGGFVSLTPGAMDPFFEEGTPASLCAKVTASDEFVIIVGGRDGEPGDYTLEVMVFSGLDADNDGFYQMNYCGPGCNDNITCGDDCVDNDTELEAVGKEWLDEYGEEGDTLAGFMADHDPTEFTPCPDDDHRRYFDDDARGWISPEMEDGLDYNCSGGLTPVNPPVVAPELDLSGTPLQLDGEPIVAMGSLSKAPDEEGVVGDFDVVIFDLTTPPQKLSLDNKLSIHVEYCTDFWCPEGWDCQDEEVMIQYSEVVQGIDAKLSGFKLVRGDTLNFSTMNPDDGRFSSTYWYVGVGQWSPLMNCPDVPYEVTISYESVAVDADNDGYFNLATGGDDCDDNDPDIHPCNLEICGNGIDEDCSGEDWTCVAGLIDEIEPNNVRMFGDPLIDDDFDGVQDAKALLCTESPERDGCIPNPIESVPVTIRGDVCQTGKLSTGLFSMNTDAYYINLADGDVPFDFETVLKFTLDWSGNGKFGYNIIRANGNSFTFGNAGSSPIEFSHTMFSWYDSSLGEYRADYIIIIGGTQGDPGEYTLEISAGEQSSEFCPDNDYDGYETEACGGMDCNDANKRINPGAAEKCDGIDNACESPIWTVEYDDDADGYGACDTDQTSDCYQDPDCLLDPVPDGTDCFLLCDCDDTRSNVHPGAADLCNGIDDNCDLVLAEAEYDDDGDGYVECTLSGTPAEGICGGQDCDDDPTDDPADCFDCNNINQCVIGNHCTHCAICINPGQSEKIPDGVDNDCDGLVDELW